jgi:hypothetical protein
MGEMVTFKSNGHTCDGYIAGSGPGVLVIQEWWGLVPHIKDVVDRLAAAGFTALAPDLYHGQASAEPDGAGKLMMALNVEQAGKDMSGGVDLLRERTGNDKVGVVGYCMGGAGRTTRCRRRVRSLLRRHRVAERSARLVETAGDGGGRVRRVRRLRRPGGERIVPAAVAQLGQGRDAARAPRHPSRVLQRLAA